MKTIHLAVDLGATSGRTILAQFDGEKVTMEELTRFKHPMLPIAGHIFWNLPELFHQILLGLKCAKERLSETGEKLSSIGIDTWGCDVAYFNEDGTIAGLPYCYRDSHTDGAIQLFADKMSLDELYSRTGIQFMNFNTLFQLFTLQRNGSATPRNAHKILFMPDALAYMLTGKAVTEYTIASTSQILNPLTGDLDETLLQHIGINRNQFCPITKPGTVIAPISKQVQQFTGLNDVPVISVCGHDTASAIAAIPTPDANFAYLSCGTWSLLGVEMPKPVLNEQSLKYNFTNEGGIDGTTRFLKNIIGLWIFEQCRLEWPDAPQDVAQLVALCEQSQCQSIINPDDEAFAHPQSMTTEIVNYCQRTGQPAPQSVPDFVRVIFRSLAHRYGEILQQLRDITHKEISRLHVIGGGSRNKYLMQYTANQLQIPVVAGPSECTALGNILVQLRACKQISNSLDELRQIAIRSTETITYQPQK
ncbi:MAG: rhamnulokinase family protein [Muribaculaceae bacterium]